MYHTNSNVNLVEENVIQINSGITINVDMSIKNVMYMKEIRFGILQVWENGKYLASITDNSVIMCDEIIEEETKTVTTNFKEKKKSNLQNKIFLYFTRIFIN